MNSTLLNQIASDLNITEFVGENQENYINRVLYSSVSLWLKTICLDAITQLNQENYSISKHHYHNRGEFVLNNLLDFSPSSKVWFYNDEKEHPVKFLRERLVRTSDILELNGDTRLYLHKKDYIMVNAKLSKVLGIPNNDFDFSSGLSLLKYSNNIEYMVPKQNIKQFYDEQICNRIFNKDEWNISKEYFNPLTKTDTLYKCWYELPPKIDCYISRTKDKFNRSIYFIEKNTNQTKYSYQISDYIIKSGLLGKILFYMRYKNNNPINIEIQKSTDFFVLKRSIKSFYGEEEIFIHSFGWPKKSLYDQLNWCFPICFYDDIICILKNLFLNIKEV